jgi:hypothetical protein
MDGLILALFWLGLPAVLFVGIFAALVVWLPHSSRR